MDVVTDSFHLDFNIVPDLSKCGRNKLTDNCGNTYNLKRQHGGNIDWQNTAPLRVGDLYFK